MGDDDGQTCETYHTGILYWVSKDESYDVTSQSPTDVKGHIFSNVLGVWVFSEFGHF